MRLDHLREGDKLGQECPIAYRKWIETGRAAGVRAEPVRRTRSSHEQLRSRPLLKEIATAVYEHFQDHPIAFEHFAASIVRMMDANIVRLDVARPSRDGGCDGIGRYRIGQAQSSVLVFQLMHPRSCTADSPLIAGLPD